MLTIRLSRIGKKSQPSFRLILQKKTASPKGRAIEILGNYQPALKNKPLVLSRERIEYWLKIGAIPSDTIASLLKKHDFKGMENFMEPRDKKRKKKGEEDAAKAGAAEAATKVAEKPQEKAA